MSAIRVICRSWWIVALLLGCGDTFAVSLGSHASSTADISDAATEGNDGDASLAEPEGNADAEMEDSEQEGEASEPREDSEPEEESGEAEESDEGAAEGDAEAGESAGEADESGGEAGESDGEAGGDASP